MCKKILFAVMLAAGLMVVLTAAGVAQDTDVPTDKGAQAYMAAPNTIMYQGRLTTAAGAPITDTVTVTFGIYATYSGGTPLWQGAWQLNPDDNGIISQEIGPIPDTAFTGTIRFLQLTVRGEVMTPRQTIASAPYALQLKNVPGVAFIGSLPANNYRAITSTTTALDSISITVPGAGYIYVSGHTDFSINHTSGTLDQAHFQVATSVSINYSNYGFAHPTIASAAATGQYVIPTEVNRVFVAPTAGTYKFYAIGRMYYGFDNSDAFFDLQMTAFYFPTSYGTVYNPAPPAIDGAEDLSPAGAAGTYVE
jgi:opacity protein-like surface antigen